MTQDRPNVLLLMSDEHSFRGFSHRQPKDGGEPVHTPALDNLAENGANIDQTYCSTPLCTPSRISLLTGREPKECGAWTNKSVLRPGLPTIPQTLGEAGYETCLIGKMHLGGNRQFCGFNNRPYGDLTGNGGHETDPLPNLEHEILAGAAKMPIEDEKGNTKPRVHPDPMRSRTADAGVTEIPESLLQETNVIEETVGFLREQDHENPEQPWFLTASFSRPHFPMTVPKRYFKRYWPDGVTDPPAGRKGDTADHRMIEAMAEQFQTEKIGEEELLRARAAYFACIDYLDDRIGDLFAMLERDELLEDTIIIYTSDHGELAGEHGLWWKHSWHEASARVPWFIQLPDHRKGMLDGAKISTPASLLDLYPTICSLVNVDAPESLDGADLSDAIRTGTEPDRGPVFTDNLVPRWGRGTEFRMVRDGRYKYIRYRTGDEHLFDLETDPMEQNDISKDETVSNVRDRLAQFVVENLDFDEAEQRRIRDQLEDEEYVLPIPKGTGNAYMLPDGRLVDAGTTLFKPDVLADHPPEVFQDWPEETTHDVSQVSNWRKNVSKRWPGDSDRYEQDN